MSVRGVPQTTKPSRGPQTVPPDAVFSSAAVYATGTPGSRVTSNCSRSPPTAAPPALNETAGNEDVGVKASRKGLEVADPPDVETPLNELVADWLVFGEDLDELAFTAYECCGTVLVYPCCTLDAGSCSD
jgi:hypothetical protein